MSKVKNVFKNYGDFHLSIPEMEFVDQGMTALWGPSGSGKSSVVRCLVGLDACPGMEWLLDGVDVAKLPVRERRFGVVFQGGGLFQHMTAMENIRFALEARDLSAESFQKDIQHMAEVLKVENLLSRSVKLLSGGEKQRISLIRGLIAKPRFLFLDEPFSALDEANRDEARQLVKKVLEQQQVSGLVISHDSADVAFLANRILQIQNGKIVGCT